MGEVKYITDEFMKLPLGAEGVLYLGDTCPFCSGAHPLWYSFTITSISAPYDEMAATIHSMYACELMHRQQASQPTVFPLTAYIHPKLKIIGYSLCHLIDGGGILHGVTII